MRHPRLLPTSCDPLPPRFLSRLVGFADLFTRPTWSNVLVLLAGVILAPGRRTVAAALRILGRDHDPGFATFHRLLNRAVWSARAMAGRLLILLVQAFVPPDAPIVIGLDDTIERRWGPKISARGIYRDPVRSSKGHFVKASGLRWLSAMLLVRVPWADRIMALPFLTLLAPSKRFYTGKSRAPKTLLDWARQAALQIHRWLPDRPGRRQRVCSHRIPRCSSQLCLCRHPLAPRCQPVRLPAAKAQRPRPTADQRQAPQKVVRPHQGSKSLLEALPRQSLVRPNQPPRRHRQRHRVVVSQRRAPGADPLASRPRSQRRARTAGLP